MFRQGAWSDRDRDIPDEVPIAMTYNRVTHAVMMATPEDLEDFALGFSLAEEIVGAKADIEEFATVFVDGAVECRMWIDASRMARLEQRRRRLAGATGCGMCGLESLAEAQRPPPPVPEGRVFAPAEVAAAMRALAPAQTLNEATRAVHAAGFWTRAEGLVFLREDVGRHNALDKLAGGLARAERSASDGIVVMTSRVSVELIQKAAMMGAPLLAAVSAPTARALRIAEASGITVVGIARDDGFEVFTHPRRVRR